VSFVVNGLAKALTTKDTKVHEGIRFPARRVTARSSLAKAIRQLLFFMHLSPDLYSQTESPIFVTFHASLSQTRNSAFVFIAPQVLLIRAIDFFFQNFSNRAKKNNQLDTAPGSQYFLTHWQGQARGVDESSQR